MVKGCQKKTIHIKDIGSRYYEEAYFVLRPGVGEKGNAECDMIKEAVRIASESLSPEKPRRKKSRLPKAAAFFAGVFIGITLLLLVQIIF